MMVEGKKGNGKTDKALPDGWRWVKLGDLADWITKGSTPTTYGYEWEDSGVLFLRSECVIPEGLNLQGSQYISELAHQALKRSEVLPGDILIRITGEIGKACIFPNGLGIANINQHIARLRIREPEFAVPEYVVFVLNSPEIIKGHYSIERGATHAHLSLEQVKNTVIPLPPIEEQRRMVAILSERLAAVDQARRATQAQLEAAQALPAAYLREIFNSPEAQTWKRKPLGDVADFKNGINFTSDQKGKGLLTVDVLNMYSDNLFIRINDLYRVDIEASEDYLLKPDDILFVRSSVKQEGVGWTALCPDLQEPMTFCGFIIRTRLTTYELIPEFLAHYCRTSFVREELISKSGTGTITNISQTQLKTLTVPLPSLDDQKRIVQALNEKVQETHRLQHHLISQLDKLLVI